MSDFLDLQGAKDLNVDAIHIGAVANSKDPVTGAQIDTHVNRVGGVDYTLQGFWDALGPVVMPWTSVVGGTLTQPNQAFLHPANGNYYSWTGAYPAGGYVVAPGTNPVVAAGYVPRTGGVLRPSVMEALRRSYAEAGYTLVAGSFEAGGTVASANDVMLYEATGVAYSYGGALPHTIGAGDTPIGNPQWVGRSDVVMARTSINIKTFGAIGDGVYHPLSEQFATLADAQVVYPFVTSLSESIDGAALIATLASGFGVEALVDGKHVINQRIVMPDFSGIRMLGRCYDFDGRSMLLAYGTGPKSYTIPDCLSTSIVNPDVGAPYLADSGSRGDVYKTNDYSVPFSAFIVMGICCSIKGGGVYPYFDGVAGYLGSDGRMADDWDVGVWSRNANGWVADTVCVEGHWRKAGFLLTAHDLANGKIASNELGQAQNCHFGGKFGVSIRTPNTATGTTNYGFAGTDFVNCRLRSLNHQSLHLATSSFLTTPMNSPSGALEIDGPVMRGIQFLNSTLITRDDIIMFLGRNSEILFDGCYEESRNLKVNGVFITATGGRIVTTPNTGALTMDNNTKFGVDFSPYYPRESSVSRYTVSSAGVNNPTSMIDDDFVYPHYSSLIPVKLRSAAQTWTVLDKDGNHVFDVDATGNLLPAGSLLQSGTLIRTKADTLNIQRTVAGVVTTIMAVFSSGSMNFTGSSFRPEVDDTQINGGASNRWAASYVTKRMYTSTVGDFVGANSPEGVVTGGVGSTYRRTNGVAGSSFYVKESGTGNTGWVAK